jgi:hypothetical protein
MAGASVTGAIPPVEGAGGDGVMALDHRQAKRIPVRLKIA